MRFRLLRRRLTISAPRMAIRSHMPWPLTWVASAVVLGAAAAAGLWAFEFGKEIAGLDGRAKEELAQLRAEVKGLRADKEKAQSVANSSASLVAAEKAAHDKLAAQVKQLEGENRSLKDDLGFYERLLPNANADGVSIRALQMENLGNNSFRWQVLLIQPSKNAPEFNGRLELNVSGTQAGKTWSMGLPTGAMAVQFRQSRRYEGVVDIPAGVVPKAAVARLTEGSATRAVQNIKL
jgi:hypothetical protein